jgi:hypothetical protein
MRLLRTVRNDEAAGAAPAQATLAMRIININYLEHTVLVLPYIAGSIGIAKSVQFTRN